MNTTKEIQHQYDELLPTSLPGVEVHVIYNCESQITYDHEGNEESNLLTAITCTVNGAPADIHEKKEMENAPQTNAVWESYRKYSNKRDLKIAERNAVKFYAWLEKTFPVELPWRVYAIQIETGFLVIKAWNYGSVQDKQYIGQIPPYDRFDPDFNPETFYKK